MRRVYWVRDCFILALAICLSSAVASAGVVDGKDTSDALDLDVFPGVWKMCFHPKLEGLSEPDSAYRVLLPGGGYVEFYGGQDGGRYATHGKYQIEGHAVVFEITSKQYADGRNIEPTRTRLS